MKKIVFLILIVSISLFAKGGDFELSHNLSSISGLGLGVNYNFTDCFRVKLAGIYLLKEFSTKTFAKSGSVSFSIDFFKLDDDISSFYFVLGANTLYVDRDDGYYLAGVALGVGFRYFNSDNFFYELELGAGGYLYDDIYDNNELEKDLVSMIVSIMGGINLGYRF